MASGEARTIPRAAQATFFVTPSRFDAEPKDAGT
jgi:hypothetical protein